MKMPDVFASTPLNAPLTSAPFKGKLTLKAVIDGVEVALIRLFDALHAAQERRASRAALQRLDDRMRADIGLGRGGRLPD